MTLKIKYIFFLTVLITFSFSASNRIGQQQEDGEILINILKSKEGIIDLNTGAIRAITRVLRIRRFQTRLSNLYI